jgi:Holliday junction resolvasome RuvABC ATP-dependent DNA helicase subunit
MATTRKYVDYTMKKAAAIIAGEVIEKNISTGWGGNFNDLEKLKNELRKYNIFYIDDIHGEWAYVDN